MVLRAAECLHALAVCSRLLVDVLSDRGRADEADCLHDRALEQRVDGDLVAVHDVQHAIGQACLAEEICDEDRGAGVALRGLQHDGVAARDRASDHPERNHDREVEGGDRCDHADGLLDRVHVDAGRNLLVALALQEVQQARSELDVLKAARDLARSVREHLAVLARHDRGELGGALLEQLAQVEEDVCALGQAGLAPCGQCCLRCGDGLLDGCDRSDAELVLHLAGRGVVDGLGALGVGDLLTGDDVGNACHGLALSVRIFFTSLTIFGQTVRSHNARSF